MNKKSRQKAFRKGYIAEYIAAVTLFLKGYRICNMRYKTKLGEIDIIAKKGDLAVFIEVKARHSIQQGVDAVSLSSQSRIRSASDIWLGKEKNPDRVSQRYDIIVIIPWRLPIHLPDAF